MVEERANDAAAVGAAPETIPIPAATAWPMTLALGVALVAGGLVSDTLYCALGGLLMLIAIAGWIGQLLPGRGEIEEPVAAARPQPVREVRRAVAGVPERPLLPGHIRPYSAGVKGGFLGGIAMAVIAEIWGVVSGRGLWYPVNLLAGTLFPGLSGMSVADLETFNGGLLVIGLLLHAVGSLGTGLIAGVLLPMLPGYPIIWGGLVAPIWWSAFVWGFMGVINPTLDQRVNWPWFIGSQFAYGLVMGAYVTRAEKVPVRPLEGAPPPEVGRPEDRP
jgi:hypothetical protein